MERPRAISGWRAGRRVCFVFGPCQPPINLAAFSPAGLVAVSPSDIVAPDEDFEEALDEAEREIYDGTGDMDE